MWSSVDSRGPWAKNANFNMVNETATEFFANFTRANSLYGLLYEWIVLDLDKGVSPPNFGSDEHRRELWLLLKELPIFKNLGDQKRRSR